MLFGLPQNVTINNPLKGQDVSIGSERFRVPEALFQPSLLSPTLDDSDGIHRILFRSISNCDDSLHVQLYKTVVLSGERRAFALSLSTACVFVFVLLTHCKGEGKLQASKCVLLIARAS